MIECPVHHPALPALFDPMIPDHPALWAVFKGRHTGRAVVDDIEHPMEFYDYDPHSAGLADLRQRLPADFELRPIDRQLIERCEWRSDMEFYCGSLDNFLVNGLGLCLMQGDEIIVEAYVSSFGDAHAEIGAVTRQACRGRGYAPITCAYLIEACEERGYHAYWSCDVDNPASARVARKLGFRQEQAYQVLEYRYLP